MDQYLRLTIRALADTFGKAFERITVVQLEKAFEQVSDKAGPGETGILRAAAEIAVHVGAFGTEGESDFGTSVKRLMSRLLKATNQAKKMAEKKGTSTD